MAEKIKRWFEVGLWTETMVRAAAERGVITEAQLREILGG